MLEKAVSSYSLFSVNQFSIHTTYFTHSNLLYQLLMWYIIQSLLKCKHIIYLVANNLLCTRQAVQMDIGEATQNAFSAI